MISILLVDDDKLFVSRIKDAIHWESIGIDAVLTAYSLQQAQEIIKMVPVDIVLSDIEMPQGSGLELLEWISQDNYPIACIFLSSYARFSYAQKALELHSINYLLKPISSSRLETELCNAVDYIRKNRQNESHQIQEKTEFWNEYILHDRGNEGFLSRGKKGGVYFPDIQSYLLLLRIIPSQKRRMDSSLLNFIVSNVTEELFQKTNALILQSIIIKNDYEIFLVANDCRREKNEVVAFLESYAHELERMLESRVYVYLSNVCRQRDLIHRKNKLDNILKTVIPGKEAVILESDWMSVKEKYSDFSWEKWEEGSLNDITIANTRDEIIDTLWQMWRGKELTRISIRQFRSEFMQLIYSYFGRMGVSMQMVFEASEYDTYYDKSIETVLDMEKLIGYTFDKMISFRQQDNKNENIVSQLKDYIQGHLGEELSRKVLASLVYLSEDYISKIFSEVTGSSLSAYITGKRMEKAEKLLKDTDYPVSKIAMAVGFSNFSYFSKNFRNYTGCTPNEYRNRLKNSKK